LTIKKLSKKLSKISHSGFGNTAWRKQIPFYLCKEWFK